MTLQALCFLAPLFPCFLTNVLNLYQNNVHLFTMLTGRKKATQQKQQILTSIAKQRHVQVYISFAAVYGLTAVDSILSSTYSPYFKVSMVRTLAAVLVSLHSNEVRSWIGCCVLLSDQDLCPVALGHAEG